MAKRGGYEIIMDFLFAIKYMGSKKKTRILQTTGVGWRTFDEYYTRLLKSKLIEEEKNEDVYVRLTKKGEDVLNKLLEVTKAIDENKYNRYSALMEISNMK